MKNKILLEKKTEFDHCRILYEARTYFRHEEDELRKIITDIGSKDGKDYQESYTNSKAEVFEKEIESKMLGLHLDLSNIGKSRLEINREIDNLKSLFDCSNNQRDFVKERIRFLEKYINNEDKENTIIFIGTMARYEKLNENEAEDMFEIDLCLDFSFWNTPEELAKIFIGYFEDDLIINNNKLLIENMIERESLQLLNKLNIPIKDILIENYNDVILSNYWNVTYQISINVDDDFEKNSRNEDHIAYSILDIFGSRIDGNILTIEVEEIALEGVNGREINPLDESEIINNKLKKYVISHIENNLLAEYLDGERLPELLSEGYSIKIIDVYFEDKDLLIEK
ncbi:MAG: hypothetical protein EBR24_04395 [Flavobacteriia bacterium]|nr:hypothetical protein [Flavobacteriia bacterium]